jgi:hypothetical protein
MGVGRPFRRIDLCHAKRDFAAEPIELLEFLRVGAHEGRREVDIPLRDALEAADGREGAAYLLANLTTTAVWVLGVLLGIQRAPQKRAHHAPQPESESASLAYLIRRVSAEWEVAPCLMSSSESVARTQVPNNRFLAIR